MRCNEQHVAADSARPTSLPSYVALPILYDVPDSSTPVQHHGRLACADLDPHPLHSHALLLAHRLFRVHGPHVEPGLHIRSRNTYVAQLLGEDNQITALDAAAKTLTLVDGRKLQYDSLISTMPLDLTLTWLDKKDWADGLTHRRARRPRHPHLPLIPLARCKAGFAVSPSHL